MKKPIDSVSSSTPAIHSPLSWTTEKMIIICIYWIFSAKESTSNYLRNQILSLLFRLVILRRLYENGRKFGTLYANQLNYLLHAFSSDFECGVSFKYMKLEAKITQLTIKKLYSLKNDSLLYNRITLYLILQYPAPFARVLILITFSCQSNKFDRLFTSDLQLFEPELLTKT